MVNSEVLQKLIRGGRGAAFGGAQCQHSSRYQPTLIAFQIGMSGPCSLTAVHVPHIKTESPSLNPVEWMKSSRQRIWCR